ncbi:MAG TPA: hypothetical protein VK993_11285 [Chthoniobacterales bacterium]|nr:hypothetical protein [Chthoniobacterales bacterium]
MRRLTATILFALLIASGEPSFAQSRANKGHTDGTFAGIEQGDYAHFLLKDVKGRRESYFILRPDKSVESYLKNPDKLKGRKIRVHWEERNEEIPEAGGKQRIKVVTKVDARSSSIEGAIPVNGACSRKALDI